MLLYQARSIPICGVSNDEKHTHFRLPPHRLYHRSKQPLCIHGTLQNNISVNISTFAIYLEPHITQCQHYSIQPPPKSKKEEEEEKK